MKRKNGIHPHDTRYKKFFSNHEIFRQLLTQFVHEDFVKDLDLSVIKPIPTEFITHVDKRLYNDILYSVKIKGREAYIYILTEFQSTNDKFMSLRFNRYITEFYFRLIKGKKQTTELPAVFPVLVYSGKSPWNAPVELQDLINNDIPKRYIPSLRYYPICINEYKREDLEKMHSALSAAMIAENTNIKEIDRNFTIIRNIVKKENPSTIKAMTDFLLNLFEKSGETEYINRYIKEFTPEDGMSIFTESLERVKKENLQKGISQGIEEGKIEDARNMLAEGLEISLIQKITGLSRRKISGLRKN
ncbi:MAG: Rpn family recombination-promoting nuclease/putative transposase [Fibrobacterota bacterium]